MSPYLSLLWTPEFLPWVLVTLYSVPEAISGLALPLRRPLSPQEPGQGHFMGPNAPAAPVLPPLLQSGMGVEAAQQWLALWHSLQ